MERQKLFVYGTLKRGQFFHDEFLNKDNVLFIAPANTTLDYTLYVGGAAHLIREKAVAPAKGELYEVSPEILVAIDRLEGHPNVYRREVIDVVAENVGATTAWAYLRPFYFKDKHLCYKETEYV